MYAGILISTESLQCIPWARREDTVQVDVSSDDIFNSAAVLFDLLTQRLARVDLCNRGPCGGLLAGRHEGQTQIDLHEPGAAELCIQPHIPLKGAPGDVQGWRHKVGEAAVAIELATWSTSNGGARHASCSAENTICYSTNKLHLSLERAHFAIVWKYNCRMQYYGNITAECKYYGNTTAELTVSWRISDPPPDVTAPQ